MTTDVSAVVGREDELEAVNRFFGDTDALPGVLLLEGEAGIGKTTLWHAAIDAAETAGYRVLRSTPSQAEATLAYAAAADLIAPVGNDVLGTLPDVQLRALTGAVLLQTEDEVDRRAIATAFLGVLRELAAAQPLLVAVDDLQWLDAESALLLSFATRRLTCETIAFVLARRGGEAAPEDDFGQRVQHVVLEPLSLGALHRLIRERLGEPLPRPLLRRIHETSGGNPFFALELASVAHRDSPSDQVELPTSLERLVEARLLGLPRRTREALAELAAVSNLAAAAPAREAVVPAVEAGVLRFGRSGLEFAHPLLRAAAYAQLTPADRAALHRRLAGTATGAQERAHHLALATASPDDGIAAVIEEGAADARRRGAPAVAGELLDHAIRLTQDEDLRVQRTLRAATTKIEAGDAEAAREALASLLAKHRDGAIRAEILATLVDEAGVEVERAIALAEQGLTQSGISNAIRARLLLALSDNVFLRNDLRRSAEHARNALSIAERVTDKALLARAISWNGQLASLTASRDPWALFERARQLERDLSGVDPWRAAEHWQGVSLMWTDCLSEARTLLVEQYERATDLGNEAARSGLGFHLAQLECRAGDFARADGYAREGYELAVLGGNDQVAGILLNACALAAAHAGDEAAARSFDAQARAKTAEAGDVFFAIHHRVVMGFLESSLGDYAAVRQQLDDVQPLLDEIGVGEPGVFPFHGDEIEALVALGDLDGAERLIASLEVRGRALDRPRLRALAWRGRGMVLATTSQAVEASRAFSRALEEHERIELPLERGRTLLAQGVALRRLRQKRSARESLEEALSTFEALGARVWAERTRNELARVGGRAPSRGELTPTERRVAELASVGKANKEIAAELHITVNTVETHLAKVYKKLGIRSRGELAHRLST